MESRTVDLGAVAEVADALGELNQSVVFVGGAVVSIYADDPAADEIRPTQDIDLTFTFHELNQGKLDEELAKRGFHLDMFGHAICSYRYKDILVDIMPAIDTVHGSTNPWFKAGFDSLQTIQLQKTTIQILSAPCYLATKFEAFNHRGQEDYRTSHDFEDIVYVLDNRTSVVTEIKHAREHVQIFLKSEVRKILDNKSMDEILTAHLHPLVEQQRFPILLEKLQQIAL